MSYFMLNGHIGSLHAWTPARHGDGYLQPASSYGTPGPGTGGEAHARSRRAPRPNNWLGLGILSLHGDISREAKLKADDSTTHNS